MAAFIPVNRLEELLVSAATDPAARPDFYRELLRAKVYLLSPQLPARESSWTAQAGATIDLVSWDGPSGSIIPMFTSRERVQYISSQTGKVTAFIAIDGSAAFGMLAQRSQDAVLNPGLPYGKRFAAPEILRLAAGTVLEPTEQRRIVQPTRVLLGQPAIYPQALVEALTRSLRQRPAAEAAYLAQIHFPDEPEPPHPIVGIVSSDYAGDVREVGPVATDAVAGAGPVDFVDMRGRPDDSAARYMRANTTPFYERGARNSWWRR